jgi:phosphoribosyl-AMP cyclohydrolase
MGLLKNLEDAQTGTSIALASLLDTLPYNAQGLIAAIAQDATSRQVLMLAWMDRTAIERTIEQGQVWYFSRSRNTYWRKGESSGHTQQLKSMAFDCDGDAVLLEVNQTGPACHTDRTHCFYLQVQGQQVVVTSDPVDSNTP